MKRFLASALLPLALLADSPFAFYPSDEPPLKAQRDVSLYAEGLLLQAKEDGLQFAIEDSNGAPNTLTYGRTFGFSSHHGDYGYNPGMRVGMAFLRGQDEWKFDISWSWLKIANSKQAAATSGGTLIPLWLLPTGFPSPTRQTAHAVWNANYNLLDASMGKSFRISHSLSAAPHFGVRIAFIDQHFSIHYGGLFGAKWGSVSHNDNDFAGLGLRGGVGSEWKMGRYWALFSNASAAVLWGEFTLAQQLSQGTTEGYDLAEKIDRMIPNAEIAAGLRWTRSFKKDQFRIESRLAYEFHEWWDMNQLRRFFTAAPAYASQAVSRGDFSLNGFSLRLQIEL